MRTGKIRFLLVLFFLLVMIGVGQYLFDEPGRFREDAEIIGKPVANISLKTLSGRHVKLSELRGKVILLNVWDTKCPPCIREFPGFISLYKKYKNAGLEIFGLTLALYENQDGLSAFVRKQGLNYNIAIVKQKVLHRLGGVKGIPVTFLIDRNGILIRRYMGYQPKEVFEEDIRQLLDI
ncbi:MAG: TlpA disulfide reductase family protein [candidate division KSB1 bacterium]|nr:TlpA disulfide reductase family protein [candidate division KSB1 bacterium]MDQ7064824.1 TlpA disulfide reductase family protein [candidate division KSB1 bacterium]